MNEPKHLGEVDPAELADRITLSRNGRLPVTVWPREDRASGMIRDTEPGLQPWHTELIGLEYTDGKWKGISVEIYGVTNRRFDLEILRLS